MSIVSIDTRTNEHPFLQGLIKQDVGCAEKKNYEYDT